MTKKEPRSIGEALYMGYMSWLEKEKQSQIPQKDESTSQKGIKHETVEST